MCPRASLSILQLGSRELLLRRVRWLIRAIRAIRITLRGYPEELSGLFSDSVEIFVPIAIYIYMYSESSVRLG